MTELHLAGDLLPLYLRREPSREPNAPSYRGRRAFDVVAYKNQYGFGEPVARWPWHASNKPRKGAKQATTRVLNCWTWRVIWLPDIIKEVHA